MVRMLGLGESQPSNGLYTASPQIGLTPRLRASWGVNECVDHGREVTQVINRRIEAAVEAIRRATAQLGELLADLATREDNPSFQKAKHLFGLGWRRFLRRDYDEDLFWFSVLVYDSDRESGLDPAEMLGLVAEDDYREVMQYLVDLSLEADATTSSPSAEALITRTDLLIEGLQGEVNNHLRKPFGRRLYEDGVKRFEMQGYSNPDIYLLWRPNPTARILIVEVSCDEDELEGIRPELEILRSAIAAGDPRLQWEDVRVVRRH